MRIGRVQPEITGEPSVDALAVHLRNHEPHVGQTATKNIAQILNVESRNKDCGIRERSNPSIDCLGRIENAMYVGLCVGLAVREKIRLHVVLSSSASVDAGGLPSSETGPSAARFSLGSCSSRSAAGTGCCNSLAAIICIRAVSYRYSSDCSRSGSFLAYLE